MSRSNRRKMKSYRASHNDESLLKLNSLDIETYLNTNWYDSVDNVLDSLFERSSTLPIFHVKDRDRYVGA